MSDAPRLPIHPCWLITSVGKSPKTVTQMLWALEAFNGLRPERVFLLRTGDSADVPADIRTCFPSVESWRHLPLKTRDVNSPKGVEAVRRGTYRYAARVLGTEPRPPVCFDITGGRKVMSVALHAAAQLLSREDDRAFFVEALDAELRKPDSSKWLPTAGSDVFLAEVPLSRLAFVAELQGLLPARHGLLPIESGALDAVGRNARFLAERGAIALGQRHETGDALRSLRLAIEREDPHAALTCLRRIEAAFAALESLREAAPEGKSCDFAADLWPDLRTRAEDLGLGVSCEVPPGTKVRGRRDVLLLPFLNMVRNAFEARATRIGFRLGGPPRAILVSNDGPPISASVAGRVGTAPLVSTKRGRLRGVGMWLAARIAEAHGSICEEVPSETGVCWAWRLE